MRFYDILTTAYCSLRSLNSSSLNTYDAFVYTQLKKRRRVTGSEIVGKAQIGKMRTENAWGLERNAGGFELESELRHLLPTP